MYQILFFLCTRFLCQFLHQVVCNITHHVEPRKTLLCTCEEMKAKGERTSSCYYENNFYLMDPLKEHQESQGAPKPCSEKHCAKLYYDNIQSSNPSILIGKVWVFFFFLLPHSNIHFGSVGHFALCHHSLHCGTHFGGIETL